MNINVIQPYLKLDFGGRVRCSALHIHEDYLFVGFADGKLSIYSLEPLKRQDNFKPAYIKPKSSLCEFEALFSRSDYSKRPKLIETFSNTTRYDTAITKIACTKLTGLKSIVVLISDRERIHLYTWDGNVLKYVCELEESRHFSNYEIFQSHSKMFLLVGIKKKFTAFSLSYLNNKIEIKKEKSIHFQEKIKFIYSSYSQIESRIVIALRVDLQIVDVEKDFALSKIEPRLLDDFFMHDTSFTYFGLTNYGPEVSVIGARNKEVLIIRDKQVARLIFESNVAKLINSPVKLNSSPLCVNFFSPNYLLVVYNKNVEILDIDKGDTIQVCTHNIKSNYLVGANTEWLFFLAHETNLYLFTEVDYQSQIEQFLSLSGIHDGLYDENTHTLLFGVNKAISFMENLDDEDVFFSHSSMLSIKRKILMLRDIYEKKSILLFHNRRRYHEALVDIGSTWMLPYPNILSLFPDFINGSKQINHFLVHSHKNYSTLKGSIQSLTLKDFNECCDCTSDILGERELIDNVRESKLQLEKGTIQQDIISKKKVVTEFKKAVDALITYLTDQRRLFFHLLKKKTSVIVIEGVDISVEELYSLDLSISVEDFVRVSLSVIDTTLFLCYFYTKQLMLGPLLRLPNNSCDVDVVERSLLSGSNTNSESEDTSYIYELLDFSYSRGLHESALEMLFKLAHPHSHDNVTESNFSSFKSLTINYLQRLTNNLLDLIFKYASWILTEDAASAMVNSELIFMNGSSECETYDESKVLDFLLRISPKKDIAISYIEYVLSEKSFSDDGGNKELNVLLGFRLCSLCLEEIGNLASQDDATIMNTKYYKLLHSFLEKSPYYNPREIMSTIPDKGNCYLRLLVLVLRRLENHERALDILFYRLDDFRAAVEYCASLYSDSRSKEKGKELMHAILLGLCARSADNMDDIEYLLYSQGDKMSILKILSILPNDTPLDRFTSFFIDALTKASGSKFERRIVSHLYKANSTILKEKVGVAQSRAYKIDSPNQPCSICKRPLGKSIICVDCHNQILHYGCLKNGEGI